MDPDPCARSPIGAEHVASGPSRPWGYSLFAGEGGGGKDDLPPGPGTAPSASCGWALRGALAHGVPASLASGRRPKGKSPWLPHRGVVLRPVRDARGGGVFGLSGAL